MKTQIVRTIKHSLLIEADELVTFVEFIRSRYTKLKITAECNDDSELETDDIADIINFENPRYRRIKNLTISAHNSLDDNLRVRIENSWPFTTVSFKVTSENDESAVYTSQQLVKLFSAMKPGYDLLARVSVIVVTMVACLAYNLTTTLGSMFGFIKPVPPLPSDVSWTQAFNVLMLLMIGSFAVLGLLDWLRMTLFPKIFFMIGKQKRTMASLIKWRWIVFSGVMLSILSSVIAGVILRKLRL